MELLTSLLWPLSPRQLHEKFHGKVILVTGASSGIGRALAQALYPYGPQLLLASRNVESLEEVKRELMESANIKLPEPIVFQLDLEAVDDVAAKADLILERVGAVDILINNGGMSVRASTLDTELSVHRRIMNVNYLGTIEFSRSFIRKMVIRGSGVVVNISSLQGRISLPHRAAYSASKHALQAWSDSLRAELAGSGVSVLVVSPGYVNTNLSMNAVTGAGGSYGRHDETTEGGLRPAEVAERVVAAVARDSRELIMAPLVHRLVILVRALVPSLYFFIMAWRARKAR